MTNTSILNYNPAMAYRRFGKTNIDLSCITLGGMRYLHNWEGERRDTPDDMLKQCCECIESAMACGINHIETAYGYNKSETCYGKALNEHLKLPRDSYYLMTKGDAGILSEKPLSMRDMVEEQLSDLQTDYFDFYGFHGINNAERLEAACCTGGPVEELHKLKEEGIIKHIGFSTHAPLKVILDAINTDLFEFVNLHYYYFFQQNQPAVELAHRKDMGVFIISPNDKGGKLYSPPQVLTDICAPMTPIQWNARFCLHNEAVHTLSFGMTENAHFGEMQEICKNGLDWTEQDQSCLDTLNKRLSLDPFSTLTGNLLPDLETNLNIPEILRFRTLWKCFDMTEFVDYRYNMFQEKGHWFPGAFATEESIAQLQDAQVPDNIPLKAMLKEMHDTFYKPKES